MVEIIWTEPALLDLDDIAAYIALDNPNAATKLIGKIDINVKRLREFPLSGRNIPEFTDTKYREIIVSPCRIIYLYQEEKVTIIHVVRGEINLRRFLIEENIIHEKGAKYHSQSSN